MTLTRAEVRGTGPVPDKIAHKMGCTKDGKITAAEADLYFQTGPIPPMYFNAPNAMFTRYELENVYRGYEVVSNRPKANSFRAPCVPQIVFVKVSLMKWPKRLVWIPLISAKNAKEGHTTSMVYLGTCWFYRNFRGSQGD